jgi:L-seryl-tRNA(Ser) seleniumtransferase
MSALRKLPALDRILHAAELEALVLEHGESAVKAALRAALDAIRASGTAPDWVSDSRAWAERITGRLRTSSYRPVFNLTGTVIHTNLGRSPLAAQAWDAVRPLVIAPMNLEFDLESGRRGDREGVVEDRLVRLAGGEAATIVNNNAAALLLVLNTIALDAVVPVSRGELIEIGGSFRLPDLMERAGCTLLEVGTTNRTHLRDFEVVAPEAALLMKVHPSNYRIEGFTHEVGVKALAALAHQHDIALVVDLGSGSLIDLERYGLPHETTPREVLAQGADLVTFSGDKLLGSVQAGLVVGRADLIQRLDANPLKRALRADKVTLALLDETLKLYEQPDRLAETLPLLRTLTVPRPELERSSDLKENKGYKENKAHREILEGVLR